MSGSFWWFQRSSPCRHIYFIIISCVECLRSVRLWKGMKHRGPFWQRPSPTTESPWSFGAEDLSENDSNHWFNHSLILNNPCFTNDFCTACQHVNDFSTWPWKARGMQTSGGHVNWSILIGSLLLSSALNIDTHELDSPRETDEREISSAQSVSNPLWTAPPKHAPCSCLFSSRRCSERDISSSMSSKSYDIAFKDH